jgi:hypothetical protein
VTLLQNHVFPYLTFPTAVPVFHVPVRLYPLDVASRRVNIDVNVDARSRSPRFCINIASPSIADAGAGAKDSSTRPGPIEQWSGQLELPGQEEGAVTRREAEKGGAS